MRLKKRVRSDKIKFEYFVNVTSDGLFTTYLPSDAVEMFEKFGIRLNCGIGRKPGYFESKSLEGIVKLVSDVVSKFNEKKLIESKTVIRYDIITACNYCKTSHGEVVPNGVFLNRIDGTEDFEYSVWSRGTQDVDNTRGRPYGFSIFVEVCQLEKYVFPDGSIHVEYSKLHDVVQGSTIDWLNSLCGMNAEYRSDVKYVDYSEEVACFFKNAIMYVCNMNEKLKSIFGDKIEISNDGIKSLPLL